MTIPKLGECTQMEWTPRGEYVELVVNGQHLGNYFLCEQVKIDENRVNIAEIDADSDDITGGYLMELDVNYDEAFKFKSAVKNLPWMFKEPYEDISDAMFKYMQTWRMSCITISKLVYGKSIWILTHSLIIGLLWN